MRAEALAHRSSPVAASAIERAPLLAFLGDQESEGLFRAAFGGAAAAVPVRRGTIRAAITALEREPTPRTLIVDLSGESDPHEALDRLSGVCSPDATVLAIGEPTDIAFYRSIREDFGITEYLSKPLTRDNLVRLFGPHVTGRRAEEEVRGGRVVVVCGVRGGVGATTVAVNLAVSVADTSRSHVALLDLHLRGGTAAMLLGTEPTAGLRAALEDPERVDHLVTERIAVSVGDRLRLLSADEPPEAEPVPNPAAAAKLLEVLRARCNLVVVDMPWPPGPVERAVLRVARQRVLVFGPDLAGVRDVAAARAMMSAQSAGTRPVLCVLNGADAPGGLDHRAIARALGGPPDIVVPHLPNPMLKAAMLGRAAVRDVRPLRRALAPLAQEISGIRASDRRGVFRWLFGRRA